MSHQLATQAARSSRRASQVLRYSAIVTAGMASIGLTVAAGSYIANEMAQPPGKLATASPGMRPVLPGPGDTGTAVQRGDIAPIAESVGLASLFTHWAGQPTIRDYDPATTMTPSADARAAQRASTLAGQVRLGNTYLGAAVIPAQRNSVSFTVDTNVFATVADLVLHTPLGESLGLTSDPLANTQLRTDVDARGEVTLTFTDPAVGRYGLNLARHAAPAPATAPTQTTEEPAQVTADPAIEDSHLTAV
ncbi:hypothetical protein AB0N05_19590 [Nocardia sp. NPDC051030]|uniref:hypothetical protein n=1 Tax=Nocardia sp. NPDC051030 TaxID=3155162 RepID=UPI00341D6662